ncbi:hypothetical protein [Streptomyces sp. NPDC018045]|uniref:hypothetical protein n=1 Tax=Streptomyces sp. NPDC018045 TaxID=3365037 RepID=UPI0037BB2D53
MERIPEVVLRGRGVVFRLEAYVVRVVRGRTSWTVPLAAISRVEYGGGRVRLELSGDAAQGDAFTLATRNATAADAFVQRLRTALTRLPSPGQGPTQVVREDAGRRLPRVPAGAKIGLAIVPYLAFFSVSVGRGAEAGVGTLMAVILLYWPVGGRDLRPPVSHPGQKGS